mmetsp:Transcript_46041/g.96693  ORF Transcript_46041/g.96693 Transcript_46041/m.96693 type:complete len:210 (+) Transcript_46041:2520-3149(+)
MKIGVRVGLTSGSEKTFALSAAHVGDVLGQVSDALLGLQLVGASREHLKVGLEATRGRTVGEKDVGETIGKHAGLNLRMERQGRRSVALGARFDGLTVRGVQRIQRIDVIALAGMRFQCRGAGSAKGSGGAITAEEIAQAEFAVAAIFHYQGTGSVFLRLLLLLLLLPGHADNAARWYEGKGVRAREGSGSREDCRCYLKPHLSVLLIN